MARSFPKILLAFLVFFCTSVYSQVSESQIKSVYLMKILENFEWDNTFEELKLAVVDDENTFFNNLSQYSKDKQISGKKLSVTHLTTVDNVSEFNIVFLSPKLSFKSEKIIKTNTPCPLIITNDLKNIENTMINFHLTYDQKLRFKVNRDQLIKNNFNPSTLLLILGGSDNDILSLFEQKDSTLVKEKLKSEQLHKEIQEKSEEIKKVNAEYSNIKNDLEKQREELLNKNIEVEEMNKKLKTEKVQLSKIHTRIKELNKNIEEKENLVAVQTENAKRQEEQFQLQNQSIIEQEKKIELQKEVLNQQTLEIEGKNKNLKTAFIFSLGLLAISVFALISYLGKRSSNRALGDKNKKLIEALAQLQKTQAKLVQSEKMASLGMVTAGMAHEINNPMTFIFTGVTILKSEIKTYTALINQMISINSSDLSEAEYKAQISTLIEEEDLKEGVQNIDQTIKDIMMGAERVTGIIKSLQNFSRLDEKDVKSIELHNNIESTLVILGSHARKKSISINTNFDPSIRKIDCFPASLNQVFVNLISNAIDAVEEKTGEINISTQKEKDYCVINIIDNGKGIPLEEQGKIFDPFFTTKEVGKGTGLGLSISYNIIKKHNGNIKVVSEVGKGTSFKIELPFKYITED